MIAVPCQMTMHTSARARPRVRREIGDPPRGKTVWGREHVWGFNCPVCWSSHFSAKWTQYDAFAAARAHTTTPTHLWRSVEAANR